MSRSSYPIVKKCLLCIDLKIGLLSDGIGKDRRLTLIALVSRSLNVHHHRNDGLDVSVVVRAGK